MAELDRRVLEGTPQKYNTAKSRIHLEYLLLLGDGEEVSLAYRDPPRETIAVDLEAKVN